MAIRQRREISRNTPRFRSGTLTRRYHSESSSGKQRPNPKENTPDQILKDAELDWLIAPTGLKTLPWWRVRILFGGKETYQALRKKGQLGHSVTPAQMIDMETSFILQNNPKLSEKTATQKAIADLKKWGIL